MYYKEVRYNISCDMWPYPRVTIATTIGLSYFQFVSKEFLYILLYLVYILIFVCIQRLLNWYYTRLLWVFQPENGTIILACLSSLFFVEKPQKIGTSPERGILDIRSGLCLKFTMVAMKTHVWVDKTLTNVKFTDGVVSIPGDPAYLQDFNCLVPLFDM